MENRTPASVRVTAEVHRRDARRTWLAAAAALLVHGGVLAALTLGAALQPEPPKISVDESIPVELVLDVPSAGPRTPSQAADLPVTEAKPAQAEKAEAPADTPPPISAAEVPLPPDTPATAPETASAAATAPSADIPPPPPPAAPPVAIAEAAPAAMPLDAAPNPDAPPAPAAELAEAPPEPSPTIAGPAIEVAAAPEAPLTLPAETAAGPALGAETLAATAPPAAPAPVPAATPPPAATELVAASAPVPEAAPSPPAPALPPPGIQPVEIPPAAAPPAAPVQLALAAPPATLAPSDPRDAVDDALKGLECAHLGADVDLLRGTVTVKGHARSDADRARLAAKLQSLPGIRRVDIAGVGILGEPYCRVLAFLDRPEFQKSTEQRGDLVSVGQGNQPGLRRMTGGETVALTLSAPEFDSYLYVDHFSADGRVTHLLPSDRPDNFLKADAVFRLGPSGDRGRRSVIGAPYGLDVIVVLATNEALLLRPRPASEDAASYLSVIDERIRTLRSLGLKLRTEYAYYLVATEPPRLSH